MKTTAEKLHISSKIIRYIIAFLLLLIIFLVFGLNENGENFDTVRFIDVGHGDCILIQSGGKTALIDTGSGAVSKSVVSKLRSYGVKKLDALVLTHPHSDHFGAAPYILSKLEVDNILVSPYIPENEQNLYTLNAVKTKASEKGIAYFEAQTGTVLKIGNFELTVLFSEQSAADENGSSLPIMAKNGDIKFLLMSDAETGIEEKLLSGNINVSCDVLKVGHHGSANASGEEFLAAAKPLYAVVSCGENSCGLPKPDALIRLIGAGATVMRTDQMGDITFNIVEGKLIYNRG